MVGLLALGACSGPRSQDVGYDAVTLIARTNGFAPAELRVLDLQVDDRTSEGVRYSVVVRTLCPDGATDCAGKQVFLARLKYVREQMAWARAPGQEIVCEPFLEAKTWRCREAGDS
jgi:hypothetical protein